MPIEVELPDGNIVEFPDGTSNATMEMALSRYRAPAPKADFSGVSSTSSTTSRPRGVAQRMRQEGFYGITPYLLDFMDSTAHHGMNALHGGAQLVQHGIAAGANALPLPAAWKQAINEQVASDDAATRQREADYQSRVDTNPSSILGAGVGEAAPWLLGTAALRSQGFLPTVSAGGSRLGNAALKGGALAAEGAAMGGTTPVTEEGAYGGHKGAQVATGAVTAPLLAGGIKGLQAGARAGRYLTNSGREAIANEQVARAIGGQNLPALRSPAAVEGFNPTPAQAIGTPEAVQAERILRNSPQSAPFFAQRESANNMVLRDAVAGLAGTDEAMAAARAARSEATDPYYGRLPSAKADPAPVLAALDRLESSSLGVNKNVKAAVSSLRSEIKSRLDSEGRMPADVLSGLHSEAGSHLGPMATPKEKKALGSVRDSIADSLDAAVPGYRDTVAAYARLSQPISDMQAGRAVLDAIDSGARDAGGNQAVNLSKINAALAKDKRAQFPMSAQARRQLEAVRDALQQRSISNNTIAASGPGTAADVGRGGLPSWMQRAGAQIAGGVGAGLGGLPGYLIAAGATEGAMAARNSVARKVGEKASSASTAASAIEAFQREQAKRGLLDIPEYLLPYTNQGLLGQIN